MRLLNSISNFKDMNQISSLDSSIIDTHQSHTASGQRDEGIQFARRD